MYFVCERHLLFGFWMSKVRLIISVVRLAKTAGCENIKQTSHLIICFQVKTYTFKYTFLSQSFPFYIRNGYYIFYQKLTTIFLAGDTYFLMKKRT